MDDTTILPDIGENGVYETSDVDESIAEIEEIESNPDIEREQVNVSDNREHFNHQVLEASWDVDFLGNADIDDISRAGFRYHTFKETPEARLARIKRELRELKQDLDDKDKEKCHLLLEYATEAAKSIENESMNGHGKQLREAMAAAKIREPQRGQELQTSSIDHLQVLQIEQRINNLENLVGNSSFNLQGVVLDLTRKVEMAASTQFEPLESQIKELNHRLEQSMEKRKQLNLLTEDSHEKANERIENLVTLLPDIEKSSAQVPQILQRLKSLADVHADVGNCVLLSNTVDTVLQDMQHEMQKWRRSLADTSSSLEDYEKALQENMTDVQRRISSLTGSSPTTALGGSR